MKELIWGRALPTWVAFGSMEKHLMTHSSSHGTKSQALMTLGSSMAFVFLASIVRRAKLIPVGHLISIGLGRNVHEDYAALFIHWLFVDSVRVPWTG
jgi:hypothetical protein